MFFPQYLRACFQSLFHKYVFIIIINFWNKKLPFSIESKYTLTESASFLLEYTQPLKKRL